MYPRIEFKASVNMFHWKCAYCSAQIYDLPSSAISSDDNAAKYSFSE